jgi:hypothetical protein
MYFRLSRSLSKSTIRFLYLLYYCCQRSPRTSVSQANSRPDEGRDRNLGSEVFLYLLKGLFRTVFECNSRQVAKPIIITDDIFRRLGRYWRVPLTTIRVATEPRRP